MLEFSRRHQEDQVIQNIEEDVKQLTKEQADLEVTLNISKTSILYVIEQF